MIEKFSEEELEIIKKELAEEEKKNNPPECVDKPTSRYYDQLADLFEDRPHYASKSDRYYERTEHKDFVIYITSAIDRIVSATLDCTEVTDLSGCRCNARYHEINEHYLSTKPMAKIPYDVSEEYYIFFDELVQLIEEHIKPYKRFESVRNSNGYFIEPAFEDASLAQALIDCLKTVACNKGCVTLKDLDELTDSPIKENDEKWGWSGRDILGSSPSDGLRPLKMDDGKYHVRLPKAKMQH